MSAQRAAGSGPSPNEMSASARPDGGGMENWW